ncbi:DUF4114 domain-containing protein [Abyssalbus ytuae]|uniref:DUF4114 domain-containing protein n=1 Tax=Abyssalbus ytuae TaxID=2926907 RepID=A0A9E6ZND8_9FLAO|nr:DUF4114 domain-containing protein [Abyssalbus ytuae]UOB19067.1 DUF4114 domain-containing protein [Abyssalbus ytuae]
MNKKLPFILALLAVIYVKGQGYNFLGPYDLQGTPLYMELDDVIDQATMDLVHNSLPESYPVPEYNPHYLSSGYDTDIKLLQSSSVYVTFLEEGAGYKNVLGFYTYDLNTGPFTKPKPEDITIVFPNVSRLGSGGGLIEGNKVKIGDFPANTGIGWVLLANGWNGSVTPGLWQLFSNPDFNPESNPDLRQHNVLLKDNENERIILGFEDIRRDYGSCDNDFNDAVFYVTADTYSDINLNNFADINDATDISSANDGGLESNGDLAKLIAKRNFNRVKDGTALNRKKLQKIYNKASYKSIKAKDNALNKYFPETALYGSETAHVSSPDDLLGITNATAVFSADYYDGEKRVVAALATETEGGIYDHSKVICDRLNNSSLEDIRTVSVYGHEIVMSVIKRQNGNKEYALTFSVKKEPASNKIYSFWNIGEYPAGNYINFQVWGESMSQATSIVNYIFKQLTVEKTLESSKSSNKIPTVFVKKGFYKEGALVLDVVNKSSSSWINLEGNYREHELSESKPLSIQKDLTMEFEERIIVNTGHLFDIGLSVKGENSAQYDALYLADGPWGIDYLENTVMIDEFKIRQSGTVLNENYNVERNAKVKGKVKETLNLFRNILPGELVFNVSDYNKISFEIKNSVKVEVILVTENLTDWNNRLRTTLEPNNNLTTYNLKFEEFKNASGKSISIENLRSIVFSVQGDYQNFSNFEIEVLNVSFNKLSGSIDYEEITDIDEMSTESEEEILESSQAKVINYPNPFTDYTTIEFPVKTKYIDLLVVSLSGKIITRSRYETQNDSRTIIYKAYGLNQGIYRFIAVDDSGSKQTGSFLVN